MPTIESLRAVVAVVRDRRARVEGRHSSTGSAGSSDIRQRHQRRYQSAVPQRRAFPGARSSTRRSSSRNSVNADLGVFVQDTWTTKRLTLSPGLRWDYFNSSIPAQSVPAGRFVPAREFAAIADIAELEQRRRRASARPTICSGSGRTAVKGNVGALRAVAGHRLRRDLQPDGVLDRHADLDRHEPRRHRAGERARTDEQPDLRHPAQPESGARTSSGRISGCGTSASSTNWCAASACR